MKKTEETAKSKTAQACPRCGYIPDRPHAALCARCYETTPWADGCSSCGKCRGQNSN